MSHAILALAVEQKCPPWVFDRGDPSVGIFGQAWIHEACPAASDLYPEDLSDAEEFQAERIVVGEGVNRCIKWRLIICCQDCPAELRIVEVEWDPEFAEDNDICTNERHATPCLRSCPACQEECNA